MRDVQGFRAQQRPQLRPLLDRQTGNLGCFPTLGQTLSPHLYTPPSDLDP